MLRNYMILGFLWYELHDYNQCKHRLFGHMDSKIIPLHTVRKDQKKGYVGYVNAVIQMCG